jgi:hypothetical protein
MKDCLLSFGKLPYMKVFIKPDLCNAPAKDNIMVCRKTGAWDDPFACCRNSGGRLFGGYQGLKAGKR